MIPVDNIDLSFWRGQTDSILHLNNFLIHKLISKNLQQFHSKNLLILQSIILINLINKLF